MGEEYKEDVLGQKGNEGLAVRLFSVLIAGPSLDPAPLWGGGGGGGGVAFSDFTFLLQTFCNPLYSYRAKHKRFQLYWTNVVLQVLTLLDSMDMSQYRQSFRREQVTGVVLALVDDDILKTDLSVSSKLHRTRLLKIVSGEVSVVGGKDSKYVQFSR